MKHLFTAILILLSFGALAQTTTVHLKGSVRVATDAKVTSVKWAKISGPAQGTIVNDASLETDVTGCVIGIYKFQLTATDNFGKTGSGVTTVTISRDGAAPDVDPGPDQNILLKILAAALGISIIGFLILRKK